LQGFGERKYLKPGAIPCKNFEMLAVEDVAFESVEAAAVLNVEVCESNVLTVPETGDLLENLKFQVKMLEKQL